MPKYCFVKNVWSKAGDILKLQKLTEELSKNLEKKAITFLKVFITAEYARFQRLIIIKNCLELF